MQCPDFSEHCYFKHQSKFRIGIPPQQAARLGKVPTPAWGKMGPERSVLELDLMLKLNLMLAMDLTSEIV
jgi:hypothetical protein